MKNLTLAIEDEILSEARKLAIDRGTTINQLVRDFLRDFITHRDRRRAARERIKLGMKAKRVVVGEKTWNRDDLHER